MNRPSSSLDLSPAMLKYRRWAVGTFLLAILVVMLGAWTRLVDAGLGCPDWPGCYGFLTVPQSEDRIAVAEARFPESPVDVSKGWPEMIHRYFAGILGLVVYGLAFAAWRLRREEGMPVKLAIFAAVLVTVQAAFGAWTVTMLLWPQIVLAHLMGGFTMLVTLFLLAIRMYRPRLRELSAQAVAKLARLRPWLYGATALVVLQIALGGWTAANYAAVACPDFPTCQGQWWPEMDFQRGLHLTQSVGPNYLGGQLDSYARTAIHMTHRLGAIVVMIGVSLVLIALARHARGTPLMRWIGVAGGMLFVQLALGVINVLLYIPLSIAVLHNIGGALLLISLVNLSYRLHPLPRTSEQAELTTPKNEVYS